MDGRSDKSLEAIESNLQNNNVYSFYKNLSISNLLKFENTQGIDSLLMLLQFCDKTEKYFSKSNKFLQALSQKQDMMDDKQMMKYFFLRNSHLYKFNDYSFSYFTFDEVNIEGKNDLEKTYYLWELYFKSVQDYSHGYENEALTKVLYAIDRFEKWGLVRSCEKLYSRLLSQAGAIYLSEDASIEAEKSFKKALVNLQNRGKKDGLVAKIKINLVNVSFYKGATKEAKDGFKSLFLDEEFLSYSNLAYLNFCYAIFLDSQNDTNEAKKVLLNSLKKSKIKNDIFYRHNNFLSSIYLEEGKIDSAFYYNKATLSDTLNFDNNSIIQRLIYLETKGSIFLKQFKKSKNLSDINFAFKAYENILDLFSLDMNRNEYFHLSDFFKTIAFKLIQCKYELYKQTLSKEHLIDALNYSIQFKNRTLQIAKQRARTIDKLNVENLSFQNNLNFEIKKILQRCEYFKNGQQIDSDELSKLYFLMLDKEKHFTDLTIPENNYENIDIDIIQKLCRKNNTQYIDLFVYDSNLYKIYINQDTAWMSKNSTFDLMSIFSNISNQNYPLDSLRQDCKDLYNEYFKGVFRSDLENIIISTDYCFNNFSFGALMTDEFNENKEQQYLIQHFAFTYINSFLDLKSVNSEDDLEKIITFSYSDEKTLKDKSKNEIKELTFSKHECELVGNFFSGLTKNFSGNALNRNNFSKNLNCDILHFAGHSVFGGSSYLDNYLIIRDKKGNPKPLYAYEIKYLQPKVKHAVLSSCESGIGEYKLGEGTFSISRAFLESGSEAVTKSLWKVNDQSTSMLMKTYYENMKTMNLSQAMRQAKLSLLNNKYHPELKHPYYWAPFVVEGNGLLKFQFN